MDTEIKADWSEMTWEEIGAAIDSGLDAVLFPIGATEQHGPHLTVGMDSNLATALCREVSLRANVPSVPLLPYGCSLGHSQRWPGTLSLGPQTLISIVTEIGDWLHAAGIRKLFLINSHVTNAAPLRCALEVLRSKYDDFSVGLFNTGQLTPALAARFSEDAADWHANAAETSLMLAVKPESVRSDQIKESDDPDRTTDCVFAHPVNRTSSNGVTGKPSLASLEEGESLFEELVTSLVDIVERGKSESPPLPHSYFSPNA